MKRYLAYAFIVLFMGAGATLFGQSAEEAPSGDVSDAVSFTYDVEGIKQGKTYPSLKAIHVDNFYVRRQLDVEKGTFTVWISGNGLSKTIIDDCVNKAVPSDWGITLKDEEKPATE